MKNYIQIAHNLRYSTQVLSGTQRGNIQIQQIDPKKWRIDVSLAVYRLPIVAPQMTEVEKQFAEVSEKIDLANSYKCNFEMKMDKDKV